MDPSSVSGPASGLSATADAWLPSALLDKNDYQCLPSIVATLERDLALCFDLDGYASSHNAHRPDHGSKSRPFLSIDLRGRHLWVNPVFRDIHACLRHILRAKAEEAATAACVVVPVRRSASWWRLRSQFQVVRSYRPGQQIFRRFRGPSAGQLLTLRWSVEIWFLPPGPASPSQPSSRGTVHAAGLRRAASAALSAQLQARSRADMSAAPLTPSISDLDADWRRPGPPAAANTRGLAAANPDRFQDLDTSEGIVPTTLRVQAFRRYHVRHCDFCRHHGHVHESCYGSWLFHALEYGWKCHPVPAPPPRTFLNYDSIEEHLDEVCDDFDVLEGLGVLGPPLATPPAYSVPLQVVTRAHDRMRHEELGVPLKIRLCLDCSRNVNDHLPSWKFRYGATDALCRQLRQGDFITVIDLSKFYLRLPIRPSSRRFFTVQDPRSQCFRSYHRVPFGHKNAPAFASLVSSEVLRIIRHEFGIRACAYLDDFALLSSSFREGHQHMAAVLRLLRDLGLPVSVLKIQQPSQRQKYLGLTFDTIKQEVSIAQDAHSFAHLRQRVSSWLSGSSLTFAQLRSACGQMSWLASCMAGARPYMRKWWAALRHFPRRGSHSLPPSCLHDAQWWLRRLHDPDWRGSRIWFDDAPAPVLVMKSDASGELGWGYHFDGSFDFGGWSSEQRQHSILFKELFPVIQAAQRHGASWAGKLVRVGLDNTGAVYCINSGSTSDVPSQALLRQLSDVMSIHQFDIVASWVPRESNVISDTLSRAAQLPHLLSTLPVSFRRVPAQAVEATKKGARALLHPPADGIRRFR